MCYVLMVFRASYARNFSTIVILIQNIYVGAENQLSLTTEKTFISVVIVKIMPTLQLFLLVGHQNYFARKCRAVM